MLDDYTHRKLVFVGEIYGPKMVNTKWKVVDVKLNEPYTEFFQSQNFELGRVGAIKLEQLEPLLLTLQANGDYTKDTGFANGIHVDTNFQVSLPDYVL